jgi:SAM-dependent methyltransferase
MGMDVNVLRLLCEAKKQGAAFERTLTLGRQTGYVSPAECRRLASFVGASPAAVAGLTHRRRQYLDETNLLDVLLGVHELLAMDYSDFEGASIQHDLNLPVPEALHNRFDAVIDAGTLEHVFHFPNAIANCMRMVKPGGRFFAVTMANNLCGHGFYQFSFELYFRIFDRANGFELEHVLALEYPYPGCELVPRPRIYAVHDPAKVHSRVGLTNRKPVILFAQARKVEDTVPFQHLPYQSDYVHRWEGAGSKRRRPLWTLLRPAYFRCPAWLRNHLVGLRQRRAWSLRNRRYYEPRKAA